MDNISPIDKVFDLLGGPSAIAKRFQDANGKPLTPWAVSKWRRRVPPERVLALERLTVDPETGRARVTRYELRPDVFGVQTEKTKDFITNQSEKIDA